MGVTPPDRRTPFTARETIAVRRIVVFAFAVPVATFLVIAFGISIYAVVAGISGAGVDRIEAVARTAGDRFGPLVYWVLLVSAGMLMAAGRPRRPFLHAASVGGGATLVVLGIRVGLGDVAASARDVAVIVVDIVRGVGLALLGVFLWRRSRDHVAPTVAVGRDLSDADDPQQIVSVVARRLGGAEVVSVGLMRRVADNQVTWIARHPSPGMLTPQPIVLPDDLAQQLTSEASFVVRVEDISEAITNTMTSASASENAKVGGGAVTASIEFLTVRRRRMADGDILVLATSRREGLRRRTRQGLLDVMGPLALALDNISLVESARRRGVRQERERLAHDIHDTVAQDFASIVTHLEAADQIVAEDSEVARRHVDEARRAAREGLSDVREVVWALRPEALRRSTLGDVVERLAKRWSEASGVAVETHVTGEVLTLTPEQEVVMLRVAQEALANVRKHAAAASTSVTLSYMDDVVALDVQDDGRGFDPRATKESSRGGFGLLAMRERLDRIGGRLLIESAVGEGCTLVAELPVATTEEKR